MIRGTTTKMKHPIRAFGAVVLVGAMALSACSSSGSSAKTVTPKDTTANQAADQPLGANCKTIKPTGSDTDTATWNLKTSSTPAMLTELKSALQDCKPIVVTMWHPHWAYAAFDIKDLKDTKGAMGEGEKIWGTANKKWAAKNSDLAGALKKFKMSDAQLASLENFTQNKFKDDPLKGAKEWLKDPANKSITDDWVDGLKGDNTKVNIGLITWDEDIAVSNLWKALLDGLGYDVTIKELDPGPLFQGMAAGDIDFFFDTWLPNTHADYWKKYGDKLTKLSDWYGGSATLNISVPKYMDIDTMDDLKAWGKDVDNTIIGIEPGAGLTRITLCSMMPGYDLAKKPSDATCDAG